VCVSSAPAPVNSIPVKITNAAGSPINVFWMSPDGSLIPQTEKSIKNGNDAIINSYNTHRFLIKFANDKPHDGSVSFTKGPYDETVTVFNENNILTMEQVSKFDEFEETVAESVNSCKGKSGNAYKSCLARSLYSATERERQKSKDITQYRDLMSARLRNYTCADPTLESSPPASSASMMIQGKKYTVNTMLDMKSSKIWTIEEFITDEECEVLMNHGRPRLTRATVAGEDGLGTISNNRRAQQASYNSRDQSDPLWSLYNRVFSFTNTVTNYNLDLPGQEGFTIIQYNSDDEYTPHCDGSCDGSKHLPKGRVATAVMYCQLPEEGGGTSFTKADIFLKPVKGMATVFAYKGTDGYMDTGFTEHSGCPVLKGEKWITTVWMRDGVDKDHTWERYDPSGEADPVARNPRKKVQEQEVHAT